MNMHTCEALLAAHEATGEAEYLDRAHRIADAFTREVAAQTDGLLWEHYTADWEADLEHNREEPGHRFRPWGYQPGHHAEWAKLLGVLAEHRGESWLRERARELFDAAIELGWDDEHGGLCYTVDGAGEPVDADKYGWVHAEALGAAAVLSGSGEGKGAYGEWYDRLWGYAAEHFRNPRHGNWYQRLARDWTRDGPNRGTAVEPGYHPLTNAWLALRYLDLADEPRPGERPGPPG